MLGSASEAEDVVQDAWLRYAAGDRADLRSPEAFLTTIVTRLCLDRLKSARAAREEYIGPWLPEPIATDNRLQPEQSASLAESLTLAFLVLLETLSPEERAVFLLREVFEYSHAEIASMLDTTDANCRQIFRRARTRIEERRPRFEVNRADKHELVGRFVSALQAGDAGALTGLLAEDVGFWGDGGGKVVAARHPLFGRDAVVNLLVGIRRTAPAAGIPLDRVSLDVVDVNNGPAVLVRVDGRLDSVYACEVGRGRITGIRVVRNPDKLAYIARQLV
jgi:RNA polymerase sigma-70 factor (ECF subfamily)